MSTKKYWGDEGFLGAILEVAGEEEILVAILDEDFYSDSKWIPVLDLKVFSKFTPEVPMTWESAETILQALPQYASMPIYAYTKTRVIFSVIYDDMVEVDSVPRHPVPSSPSYIGGPYFS